MDHTTLFIPSALSTCCCYYCYLSLLAVLSIFSFPVILVLTKYLIDGIDRKVVRILSDNASPYHLDIMDCSHQLLFWILYERVVLSYLLFCIISGPLHSSYFSHYGIRAVSLIWFLSSFGLFKRRRKSTIKAFLHFHFSSNQICKKQYTLNLSKQWLPLGVDPLLQICKIHFLFILQMVLCL